MKHCSHKTTEMVSFSSLNIFISALNIEPNVWSFSGIIFYSLIPTPSPQPRARVMLLFLFVCFFLCVSYCFRRRQWQPTPVLLPGKSRGQRSLVGCSPWGRWESDTPEFLHFHFSLSHIREGNGNPLQRSCLENPRDGGA